MSSPARECGIVRFPAPLSLIRLTISGVTLRQEPTQVMIRKLKKRRELPAKQKHSALIKHEHYPVYKAEAEFKEGQRKKYKVITINWTYATENSKQNKNKVRKNEYVWTLKYLKKWIGEKAVAEFQDFG